MQPMTSPPLGGGLQAPPPPPPAPRPVTLSAMRWNAMFMQLFGGIWALVGILITVVFTVAGGPVWNDWILDSRGVRATATPTSVEATSSRVNKRVVYAIHFSFVDRSGKRWPSESGTTDSQVIQRARAGTPIPVEYDPQDPERARLEGTDASFFGAMVLLPLAFGLAGSVLFVLGFVSTVKTMRIYKHGQPAQARVIAVEATASSQNRRRVMSMKYEFDGPGGRVLGGWKTVSPARVGSTIWVLFDPSAPEKNLPA